MPPFTGRAAELSLLQDRLTTAAAAVAQTVLVHGPPGIGKSALLAEFRRSAGSNVLVASGDEGEVFLEFGVLLQLMQERAHGWSGALEAGAELLRAMDERLGHGPTVLVVDDAHLADRASLTALTFALRRLQDDPVMAVLAVRGDAVEWLPPGLRRLAEAHDNVLALGGLRDTDVSELASAYGLQPLTRQVAGRLRRHTQGSPLYLRALLSELTATELTGEGPLPVPRSYASLVVRRLATQSDAARRLIRACAVLAEDSLLELAERLAGLGRVDAERALDELSGSELVTCRHTSSGWRLAFAHPLVRSAVYDDLGPVERAHLHRRAAELLPGEPGLLHRVAVSDGPDPVLAEQLDEQAQLHKGSGDVHRAAELVLMAANLSAGEVAAERLMEAVTGFLIAGDVTAASALDPRLAELPPGGRRFYLQSKIAWFVGRPGEAESLATRAWERADELDRRGRGALAGILAQLCNMRGAGVEAALWAERALDEQLEDDLGDSTAAARAVGLALAGRVSDALVMLQNVPEEAAAVPPTQHHQLVTRGALRAAVDDLAGALADLSAVCDTPTGGVVPHRLLGLGVLADVEFRLGRWDASLTHAVQAVSLAEDSEQRWLEGYLHTSAVLVLAGRGLWQSAEEHLARARQVAEGLGDPATLAVCENAGVHIAACRGRPDEVVERAALLNLLGGGPTHEPGLLGWPAQLLSALVELGRTAEAEDALAGFESVARERGSRSRLAALARVRGELHTPARRHGDARRAFDEALGLGAGEALEAALVRLSYGRFLRRRGERRAAGEHLHAARDRFEALGALPFVERCDVELGAFGPPDAAPRAPATSLLTPQEQMVARLVCQGLTNQEVARRLVLSSKTIGYHLGNVYTKLDVHSRTQLVNLLDS